MSYESEDSLKLYLREISKTPLLTAEEELVLSERIKKGDPEARSHMIRANLRLVVKIAHDYANYGMPVTDLISEGNIGLMKAVERFDPEKGGRLSTYAAWWIKQSIKRALANQSKTIRLPVHMVDKIAKMRRIATMLTDEELADVLPHTVPSPILMPVSHPQSQPDVALAITSSNLTAIMAELVAGIAGYGQVLAITWGKTATTLPAVMEGDLWEQRLKQAGWVGAKRQIRAFEEHVAALTDGRAYDCLLHHSKSPVSQLLSSHPLCRKFFYLEEGLTALIGGPLGRGKPRPAKKFLWLLKSILCDAGRIDKYREFYDLRAPNYGGAYALSRSAFMDYPGRVQLPTAALVATHPAPAEVVVFLDSQYFRGNCLVDDYVLAMTGCLTAILDRRSTVAIKFHPAERDAERKAMIMQAVAAIAQVGDLRELPPDFIGERMACNRDTKVVVGTTAVALYLAEQGARAFSFAPRLATSSARYAHLMRQLPPEFLRLCQPA